MPYVPSHSSLRVAVVPAPAAAARRPVRPARSAPAAAGSPVRARRVAVATAVAAGGLGAFDSELAADGLGFSFGGLVKGIGKAVKTVASPLQKVAAKVLAPVAKVGLNFLPLPGIVQRIASSTIDAVSGANRPQSAPAIAPPAAPQVLQTPTGTVMLAPLPPVALTPNALAPVNARRPRPAFDTSALDKKLAELTAAGTAAAAAAAEKKLTDLAAASEKQIAKLQGKVKRMATKTAAAAAAVPSSAPVDAAAAGSGGGGGYPSTSFAPPPVAAPMPPLYAPAPDQAPPAESSGGILGAIKNNPLAAIGTAAAVVGTVYAVTRAGGGRGRRR